jgi:lambda repressor-like predicted transcriptional regulator
MGKPHVATKVNAVALLDQCRLRGWELDELSRQAGISEQTITRIVRRGERVNPRTVRRIVAAFEATPPSTMTALLVEVGS